MKKLKINVVGSILGHTGYSRHIISLAKALDKLGHDVSIETDMQPQYERMFDDKTMELVKKDLKKDVNVFIGMPHALPMKLCEHNKGVIPFVVFEGDKIPKHWVQILSDKKIPCVFVPSVHVKKACETAGLKKNIFVVPHGVDSEVFHKDEGIKDFDNGKYNFLFVGGWAQGENDRKDLATLLRAYTEEFSLEENVHLIVKINSAYANLNYNFEISKLGLLPGKASFSVITQDFDDKTLNMLYNSCSCVVIPSMAEGFGIPLVEGFACGKPCITTNFGGQTDFCNPKNGLLVGGEFVESKDHNPIYEGVKWLKLSKDDLRKALRYAYEHQDVMLKKGLEAEKTAKKYSWDNAAKLAVKFIGRTI